MHELFLAYPKSCVFLVTKSEGAKASTDVAEPSKNHKTLSAIAYSSQGVTTTRMAPLSPISSGPTTRRMLSVSLESKPKDYYPEQQLVVGTWSNLYGVKQWPFVQNYVRSLFGNHATIMLTTTAVMLLL